MVVFCPCFSSCLWIYKWKQWYSNLYWSCFSSCL